MSRVRVWIVPNNFHPKSRQSVFCLPLIKFLECCEQRSGVGEGRLQRGQGSVQGHSYMGNANEVFSFQESGWDSHVSNANEVFSFQESGWDSHVSNANEVFSFQESGWDSHVSNMKEVAVFEMGRESCGQQERSVWGVGENFLMQKLHASMNAQIHLRYMNCQGVTISQRQVTQASNTRKASISQQRRISAG